MKKQCFPYLFLVVSLLTVSVFASTQAHAEQSTKSSDKNTILVLGDSLSAGYGFDLDKGWVNLLRQKLQAKNPNYQVINASISGDTTTQGLGRLKPLLAQHQPDTVIIELGGNDGLRGFPPKAIKQNLAKLIDQAKDKGAQVVLLGIQIPPNYGKRYSDSFYNNYLELAKEKEVLFVPEFLKGVGLNEELMQKDGIHPNEKAQGLLLETVLPFINEHVSIL